MHAYIRTYKHTYKHKYKHVHIRYIHPSIHTHVYMDIGTGQAGEVGVDLTDAGLSAARFLEECGSVCVCVCARACVRACEDWPKRSQIRRGAGGAARHARSIRTHIHTYMHTCTCT